jgi:hypothetical protein
MSNELYIRKLEKINKKLQEKLEFYEKYSKGDEPFIKELQKANARLSVENKELKRLISTKELINMSRGDKFIETCGICSNAIFDEEPMDGGRCGAVHVSCMEKHLNEMKQRSNNG